MYFIYIYIKIWILDSNAGTLIETVCAALSIMQWEYTISVVILTGSVNMGLIFFTPQNCVNGYCWICENGLDFLFFIFLHPSCSFQGSVSVTKLNDTRAHGPCVFRRRTAFADTSSRYFEKWFHLSHSQTVR